MGKNEIVKFDAGTIQALDKAAESGILAMSMKSKFEKAFTVAGAVGALREALTPAVMKPITDLQNTSLGFRTDKKAGYDESVIRDCIIEATIRGLSPCGNEFNIIADRMYITKEGFQHLLADIPGLKYVIVPGIPHPKEGGALIDMEIRYTHNGKSNIEKLPICVRVNAGMGADAIIGKATRKARAWLYSAVTGQEVGDGDLQEDSQIIDIKAETVKSSAQAEFEELKNA